MFVKIVQQRRYNTISLQKLKPCTKHIHSFFTDEYFFSVHKASSNPLLNLMLMCILTTSQRASLSVKSCALSVNNLSSLKITIKTFNLFQIIIIISVQHTLSEKIKYITFFMIKKDANGSKQCVVGIQNLHNSKIYFICTIQVYVCSTIRKIGVIREALVNVLTCLTWYQVAPHFRTLKYIE